MIPSHVYQKTRPKYREFLAVNGYEEGYIDGYTRILDVLHTFLELFPYREDEIAYTVPFVMSKVKMRVQPERVTEAFETFALFLRVCAPPKEVPADYEPMVKTPTTITRR